MATRGEKRFGIIAGATISGIIAYRDVTTQEMTHWERLAEVLKMALIGGTTGYFLSIVLGSKNDTVNYELFKKNKLVYHGITYENRLGRRTLEHKNRGLLFDRVQTDSAKPRVEAKAEEKELIQRDKPIYNIQHNTQ